MAPVTLDCMGTQPILCFTRAKNTSETSIFQNANVVSPLWRAFPTLLLDAIRLCSKENKLPFLFAGADDRYLSFGPSWASGFVEFGVHVRHDIIGHVSLPHLIARQTNIQGHIQQPELNVRITELLRALENRLSLLGIEIGVVDDYVYLFAHRLFQPLKKDAENLFRIALRPLVAVKFQPNRIGVQVVKAFLHDFFGERGFAGPGNAHK